MAVAELNKDMISLKKNSVTSDDPRHTFRGGMRVFYRDGFVLFPMVHRMTRGSENYQVRYA